MWRSFVPDACIALSAVLLWYFASKIWLRRRSREVLGWIRRALESHGEVTAVRAITPSQFQVSLRLGSGLFHCPILLVRLAPLEMPLNWLWHRLRHRGETVTFQADLENRPGFNLQVANHRWYCRRPNRKARNSHFDAEHVGALVMTTRERWDLNGMVDALLLSRSCDFLNVSFRRHSPHIQATVDIETFRPDSLSGNNVFETLRELAAGASASA